MSAITQNLSESISSRTVIELSPAWLGCISGLKAEKLLRNLKQAYLYVIRKGELENDYYISYIDANMTIRHQPIVFSATPEGWCLENAAPYGPFASNITIDDIAHLPMHCQKEDCMPLINFQRS